MRGTKMYYNLVAGCPSPTVTQEGSGAQQREAEQRSQTKPV